MICGVNSGAEETMQHERTTLGIPPNLASALAYLLAWVSGIIVLLLEKENRLVRFHAAQSILLFGALTALGVLLPIAGNIIGVIPLLGPLLKAVIAIISMLLGLAALIIWVILVLFALVGRDYRVPYIDTYADQIARQTA